MSKKLLTKLLVFTLFIFSLFVFTSYASSTGNNDEIKSALPENHDENYQKNQKKMKKLTPTVSDADSKKIMVISDVHIMSEKLLKQDGEAFKKYLQKDRKLLQESRAIAKELVNRILEEKPDLLLVRGDLTKDGELLSHQCFVEIFNPVVQAGIKMLVIPGNHDVDNPNAVYFNGDITEKAESVTPRQFSEIYRDFGYGNAISQDANSLSYVSEPIDGMRVIAIDACKYYENKHISRGDEKDYCVTEGKIKSKTMQWIKKQAYLAHKNSKQIIAMVHHNVVEHFDFQGIVSAPYLLDDFKKVQQDFMDAGIQVVFTGHFHANDIAKTHDTNGNYLYDVETGSPVTYPCPYRIIEYSNDNQLTISTKRIEKIDYDLKGEDFQTYARRIIEESIPSVLSSLITEFYPEIKQYTKPYTTFIKIPEAEKLGQIMEDNLGELAVEVMMKIYEGNNDSSFDNIMLKKLNKSIDNIAGDLARTRLIKGRIAKSLHKMDFVKKLKVAVSSIAYNMKGLNEQVVLSRNFGKWMAQNREYIDDLNYAIYLQEPIKTIQTFTDNPPFALNEKFWDMDSKWAERAVAVEVKAP